MTSPKRQPILSGAREGQS